MLKEASSNTRVIDEPAQHKVKEVKDMSFMLNYPAYPNRFKIKRVPVGTQITTKRYLTESETAKLFEGEVVIEEKIDGGQDCRILTIDGRKLVVGGEYMKYVHSITYTKLPAWYVAWDLFDLSNNVFLGIDEQLQICRQFGIPHTPVLFRGVTQLDEVIKRFIDSRRISTFGSEPAEGVVIKNFGNGVRGKIVRHEFIAGIELAGHWSKRKGRKMNRLSLSDTAQMI